MHDNEFLSFIERTDVPSILEQLRNKTLEFIADFFFGAADDYQINSHLILGNPMPDEPDLHISHYTATGVQFHDYFGVLAYEQLNLDHLVLILNDLETLTDEDHDGIDFNNSPALGPDSGQ